MVAYRQILLTKDIEVSHLANCMVQNECHILNIIDNEESKTIEINSNQKDDDNDFCLYQISSITDISPSLAIDSLNIQLSECQYAVVGYIAGYVQKKVIQKLDCDNCRNTLNENLINSKLIKKKQWGNLIYPNKDLYSICLICEKMLKDFNLFTQKKFNIFVLKAIRVAVTNKYFKSLNCQYASMENHEYFLIKKITEEYSKIRSYHEIRKINQKKKEKHIRNKYTKLVIFSNQ